MTTIQLTETTDQRDHRMWLRVREQIACFEIAAILIEWNKSAEEEWEHPRFLAWLAGPDGIVTEVEKLPRNYRLQVIWALQQASDYDSLGDNIKSALEMIAIDRIGEAVGDNANEIDESNDT